MGESTAEKELETLGLRDEIAPFKDSQTAQKENGDYEFSIPLFGIGEAIFEARKGALDDPELYEISSYVKLKDKFKPDEKEKWQKFLEMTVKIPQHKIVFGQPEVIDDESKTTIEFRTWSSADQRFYHIRHKTPETAPNPLTVKQDELAQLIFVIDNLKIQEEEILNILKS